MSLAKHLYFIADFTNNQSMKGNEEINRTELTANSFDQ